TLTINGISANSSVTQATFVEHEEVIITVTAADGVTKEYYMIGIVRGTQPSNPDGGSGYIGGVPQQAEPAAMLELKGGEAGTLSLGDEITVSIPSGAFGENIKLMIEPVKQNPNAGNLQGKKLV